MAQEITIKVGFGGQFRELTVRIQDDDVKPWQPEDRLHLIGETLDPRPQTLDPRP